MAIILFLPIIPAALPVWEPVQLAAYYRKSGFEKAGALKWEDLRDHPLPQDFADMLGWKELAEKVSFAYQTFPGSVKTKTLIHCRNFGTKIFYFENGNGQLNQLIEASVKEQKDAFRR